MSSVLVMVVLKMMMLLGSKEVLGNMYHLIHLFLGHSECHYREVEDNPLIYNGHDCVNEKKYE